VPRIAVYGASGYSGRLIAAELAAAGHAVVLAGRDPARLRAVGQRLGPAAEVRVAPLGSGDFLDGCDAVVNAAGPFAQLGGPVLEAAIDAGVPYVDTAAEQGWVHEVFERYGPLAAARSVALVPAAGVDFLPGDFACALAARGRGPLRELEVAYAVNRFRMSRGTLRSVLAGSRDLAYEDGAWRFAGPGPFARRFAFPPPFGTRAVARFPAGEVVTAPRHVPVRNVRALVAAPPGAAFLLPAAALVRGPLARAAIDRLPEGPGEAARKRARWVVVAAATAEDGHRGRVAVQGTDVYGTTARSVAHAAALLARGGRAGALAPAQAFEPEAFLAQLGVNVLRGQSP
jgi:short subunit dehydrogenase-like uncharacterized protein